MPKISKQIENFWNCCICESEEKVYALWNQDDIKLTTKSATKPTLKKKHEIAEILKDTEDGWATPLLAFKYAYDDLLFPITLLTVHS